MLSGQDDEPKGPMIGLTGPRNWGSIVHGGTQESGSSLKGPG